MNDKSVMGEDCPVGRPSVISCQLSAKDTSQKKKVFKDQKEALSMQAFNIDKKSTSAVESLTYIRAEDGLGGSTDLGRGSMGARCELHGEIPHRVHLQCRSSWLAGERTGRREYELIVIALCGRRICTFFRKRYPKLLAAKFLCKLLQLLSLCNPKFWRPAFSETSSFSPDGALPAVRLIFCKLSSAFGECKGISSRVLRQVFDWPSTVLRVGFGNSRSVVEGQSKRTRRVPEEGNTQVGKNFGNRSNLTRIILRRQPTYRQVDAMVDMTLNQGGVALRALKPYTIYLTALNVLFCVCLAHARQSSSPEAAYGVAFTE